MVPKIAVVEDEEALSVLLRYNLEAEGYDVDTISRGDEAEIRLQERIPDLLILDWMLPGVSGIELCRRLRMRPETERLPIIMLTARGEESERVRGLATGADDYVVKPFSTPELMARVKAMLRRARPEVLSSVLKCGDIEPGSRDPSCSPQEPRSAPRPDGIPPAGIPDDLSRPGFLPLAIAGWRVGSRYLCG